MRSMITVDPDPMTPPPDPHDDGPTAAAAGLPRTEAAVGSALETVVRDAIDTHGPALLFESERLAAILRDACPDSPREVDLLLRALDDEVPQDLLGAHTGETFETNATVLAAQLSREKAIAPGDAAWVVRTWARILGVTSDGPLTLMEPPLFTEPPRIEAGTAGTVGPSQAPAHAPTPDSSALPPRGPGSKGTTTPEASAAHRIAAPTTSIRAGGPTRHRMARVAAIVVLLGIVAAALAWWSGAFTPKIEVTGMVIDGALVGDGEKRLAVVSFRAIRTTVRRIERRFVRGDGRWPTGLSTFDVSRDAAKRGQAPAGDLAVTTTRPGAATFDYVLVGDDGTRSAPFEKTFEIAAGPPQPPVITAVAVPNDIVTGKPFSVMVAFDEGADPVAQVEVEVSEIGSQVKPEVTSTPLADLASPKAGVVIYPFGPSRKASRSTLDITLVDGAGVRSASKQATVDVRSPPPTPTPSLAGCTPTTCGRVVAVREAEPAKGVSGFFSRLFESKEQQGRKSYEILIRLDNGATHTLVEPNRWHPGARVRVVGSAVSLRCMEARQRCW